MASADVVMHLIKSKCILLYAVECCPVNHSLEKSLQFSVTKILKKIFRTRSSGILMECHNYFGFYTASIYTLLRGVCFLFCLVFVCFCTACQGE